MGIRTTDGLLNTVNALVRRIQDLERRVADLEQERDESKPKVTARSR